MADFQILEVPGSIVELLVAVLIFDGDKDPSMIRMLTIEDAGTSALDSKAVWRYFSKSAEA